MVYLAIKVSFVLEEEAGMATAWVDGEAMVDTAWEEVMTVKREGG